MTNVPDPSRANWEPVSPRSCSVCGRKLRITRDRIFFRMWPEPMSVCDGCMPKWRLTRDAMVTDA